MARHLTYETILDGVSDFSGVIDPNFETVTIKDPLRGGVFDKYTGSQSVDDGVIFQDSLGNKWKRRITEGHINVKWYPVVENTPMDAIFAQIMTAATNTENLAYPKIYFPKNTATNMFYQFASTVTIDTGVTLFGDGNTSKLRWAVNVPGIVTNYITSRRTTITDLLLDGAAGGLPTGSPWGSNWDINQYGLEARDIVLCNNVTFRYWAGLGAAYLYGDATHPTNPTNVNNSVFSYCNFLQNKRHGLLLDGPDTNAVEVIKIDATANGGVGVRDTSFLGNHYLHGHFASNGSPEIAWQQGLVKVGTDVYACIADGTIGIEPTVTVGWENSWVLTGETWSAFPNVQVYDATRTYYIVGGFSLEGANQYGTFVGNYAEADQARSYVDNRNVVIGLGTGLRTGSAAAILSNIHLYSTNEFWAGNPGDLTTNRSFISPRGVGVTKGGGTGLVLGWNSVKNTTEFKTLSGAEDSGLCRITTSATTGPNAGRTNAPGALKPWFPTGMLLNSVQNRTANTMLFDVTRAENPSTSSSDVGDVWLAQATSPNLTPSPETVLLKYTNTTSSSTPKLLIVKGFVEDTVTGSGTYTAMFDYNVPVNRGVLYDLTFVGSNTTDDCILHHQILIVNRGGTLSVVNDTAIRPDYVPGTYATTAFDLLVSGGDDLSIRILNLPAGNNGKINIKRIKY